MENKGLNPEAELQKQKGGKHEKATVLFCLVSSAPHQEPPSIVFSQ